LPCHANTRLPGRGGGYQRALRGQLCEPGVRADNTTVLIDVSFFRAPPADAANFFQLSLKARQATQLCQRGGAHDAVRNGIGAGATHAAWKLLSDTFSCDMGEKQQLALSQI